MATPKNKKWQQASLQVPATDLTPAYEIVDLAHGKYQVGAIPAINTEALTIREINYLTSINWPHLKIAVE